MSANIRSMIKNALGHCLSAVFLAFFGMVYENFSFGVYSSYMMYAFAIPLGLGTLPYLFFALFPDSAPRRLSVNAWNSGIAALSVGCVFKGVLDIYGTTNRLLIVYPITGAILLAVGLTAFLKDKLL